MQLIDRLNVRLPFQGRIQDLRMIRHMVWRDESALVGSMDKTPERSLGTLSPEPDDILLIILQLECGPMPNVMAALPNNLYVALSV